MAKWFYQIDGKQYGPVDPTELKNLATNGSLKSTDKVRREDLAEWYEAKKVKGLFPPLGSQVAQLPAEGTPSKSEAKPGAVWWPLPDDISKETLDSNVGRRPLAHARTETPITKWYYLNSGQEVGPVEVSDLKRLVDEGRLEPHDKVRRADGSNWNTVAQLAELFAAVELGPRKRSAVSGSKTNLVYGCGCLSVPLVVFVLIAVTMLTNGSNDSRNRARDSTQRVMATFDAIPPPIEDAIAAGKEVWLLKNCPLMSESLQDSLYVVMVGDRVDAIIVESRVSKNVAKVTYNLDGESIIWKEVELEKPADPNADFAFSWTIDVRKNNSTLVVIAKSSGIPKSKETMGTVANLYKVTATLDPGKTTGNWKREHTLDVKNPPQYSATDKHESEVRQGEAQLVVRQSK